MAHDGRISLTLDERDTMRRCLDYCIATAWRRTDNRGTPDDTAFIAQVAHARILALRVKLFPETEEK